MRVEIAAAAVLFFFCGIVCLMVRRYYRNKMAETYQNLLLNLDRALSQGVEHVTYDESMDAAVGERLRRILEGAEMNRDRAKRERDVALSLISDISHQVRTPLTNIMLYTGLLREKETEGEKRALIDKIQKASDKLDFFMRELVKSSYAEQEIISLHPQMTRASQLVHGACQMQELFAMKKNITIEREVTDDLCFADKKWTIEALGNVLENAIKYSPENSKIEVSVIPFESFVLIQVKDFGIGIREEERGLVFERFYRSKEVRDEPGFGIGLYLVREVLVRQGGYAKIKENPKGGTILQMFFSRFLM